MDVKMFRNFIEMDEDISLDEINFKYARDVPPPLCAHYKDVEVIDLSDAKFSTLDDVIYIY